MLKLRQAVIKTSLQSVVSTSTAGYRHVDRVTTVDTDELKRFSHFAQVWWDVNGLLQALHTLNRLRVPFIIGENVNHVDSETLKNTKILDVGCGGGILSEALSKSGLSVTGIDATQTLIDIATQHSKTNKELKTTPTYICATIEEHSKVKENYYDKIVASEVIEHVSNKELFVKSCLQALKPGGKIYFTCPSKTPLSLAVNILFAENVLNSPVKGTHEYQKFIAEGDLQMLLESNGCKVEKIRGFALNMFTNNWMWTRSRSLFYAVRAIKIK